MSKPKRDPRATPAEPPSDELVLSAVERAARHRARETSAVPIWAILDHLGIPRRTASARTVLSRLGVMHAAGLLERPRLHGVSMWELTSAGSRRLERARRAHTVGALPESPQHRVWRRAQTAAAQEIERFRDNLRDSLQHASLTLDEDPPSASDSWFELGERIERACWLFASASHCLHEWPEPDDGPADVDEHLDPPGARLAAAERAKRRARRTGRRNISLWRDA